MGFSPGYNLIIIWKWDLYSLIWFRIDHKVFITLDFSLFLISQRIVVILDTFVSRSEPWLKYPFNWKFQHCMYALLSVVENYLFHIYNMFYFYLLSFFAYKIICDRLDNIATIDGLLFILWMLESDKFIVLWRISLMYFKECVVFIHMRLNCVNLTSCY